ncbi:hypothetical protein S245_055338, partial [Arachis hypogaea]
SSKVPLGLTISYNCAIYWRVIDPKLKYECEEALKEGDLLMNLGKLKEALPYYDKVMDNLPFQ